MILKNTTNKNPNFYKYAFRAGIAGIGLFLLFAMNRLLIPYFGASEEVIKCDAEKVKKGQFITGKYQFNNGKTRTSKQAFKGKYSSEVGKTNNFGFEYVLQNPIAGDQYEVSVWRYREGKEGGKLVVSGSKESNLYLSESVGELTKNGWELLKVTFNIPYTKDDKFVKIYVYSPVHTAYFDNLVIKKIQSASTAFQPEALRIGLPKAAFEQIKEKSKAAHQVGIIVKEEDDWVKGYIRKEDQQMPVKLRIKGDWLDHARWNKWSFRIKVKDPHAWKQLKTFSIQTPETRNFVWEWLFHEFLKREDVLAPRYDFVEVFLNDDSKGVYAYEEHFDKHLVENQSRREGPIVKFTEEAFWLNYLKEFNEFGEEGMKERRRKFIEPYAASQIKPFKEARTYKSETLRQQFEIAQNLMYEFKYKLKPAHQIFDVERLAKYFAIIDVMRAYHGVTWHNMRFYYNPVLSKLEPIGFDGYSTNDVKKWYKNNQFIGYSSFNKKINNSDIYTQIFKDEVFMERYTAYLHLYSSKAYLNDFLLTLEPELRQREQFIKTEFEDFNFDIQDLFKHAKDINTAIEPFDELSVNAFSEKQTDNSKIIKLTSHHPMLLKVLGFGVKKKVVRDTLEVDKFLQSNLKGKQFTYQNIKAKKDVQYVFYQLPGLDSVFQATISPWKTPAIGTPEQGLFDNPTITSNAVFTVENKTIFFERGKHTIKENIIIPKGYEVVFKEGVVLDFVNRAKFISKSPVFMQGSEENPIFITSSDKSANGFTVLKAGKRSKLRYVTFNNFNTLNYKGWILTGAVTFYESDVDIEECKFVNNHCEDGLNLVRCKFNFFSSVIGNTYADGFDADFCQGLVRGVTFYKTGNDGADFSGSQITMEKCKVLEAGDKGISVGENAQVTLKSCEIDQAIIGVASKDLSVLTIESIQLKNCQQGFAAYQKKPEFGGSTIDVKAYEATNVKYLHLIEQGSKLILKGKEVEVQ